MLVMYTLLLYRYLFYTNKDKILQKYLRSYWVFTLSTYTRVN